MGESSMNEISEKAGDTVTVRDDVPPGGTRRSRLWQMMVCVLLSQMVMSGIFWWVVKSGTPEVVTFDMKGTMDIFIQQSAQQNLDEARAKQLVARFNGAMVSSLADWQQKHNAVILVQPAVVSMQQDITTDIREDIALRMKEGK